MFGDRGTFSWSIGPLISWTIPNTGAAQAIAQAEAGTKAAAARFDAAVLSALRETESALTVYARQLDRESALQAAREQSAQAASQARQLFQYGKTDYLTVLDAERTLAANESALAAAGPNSAATRSPCSWRWAAAGEDGANPTAGIESAVDAGRCYDRPVSPDPATRWRLIASVPTPWPSCRAPAVPGSCRSPALRC